MSSTPFIIKPDADPVECAIVPEFTEGLDYRLAEEPGFAWLQVGGIALRISAIAGGVKITAYRNRQEMEHSLGMVQFHE